MDSCVPGKEDEIAVVAPFRGIMALRQITMA